MELKNLFRVSAIVAAMALTGCGGDIEVTPTVNDNSVNNSNNTSNNGGETPPPVAENPCTARTVGSTEVQGQFQAPHCVYGTDFASKSLEIESDISFAKLENGGAHVFKGALLIGKDCNTATSCTISETGPTLEIKPGAVMAFTSGESVVRIARGSKINAVGTAADPIRFTSAAEFEAFDLAGIGPQFADWGGIMVNGFGITNECTDAERNANLCNADSEGVTSYYGGNNNADSSGQIKYAHIWYAGSGPRDGGPGDDLNSLTLNAVGSGSSFEFLHIHQGFDDGIEFFGGAASIKNIVVTDTQDDAIDVDAGWQGKGQFILVKHGTIETKRDVTYADDDGNPVLLPAGTVGFMGNNGFETDGEKASGDDYSQAPASTLNFANVTVITTDGNSIRDDDESQGMKFDDAIRGMYYNALIVKAEASNGTECLEFKDGDAAANAEADTLNYDSSVLACAANFKNGSDPLPAGEGKEDWFVNGGVNQILNGAQDVLAADGFSTNSSSTAITVDANNLSGLNDAFFTTVDYIGAVSDTDTSSEWYQWAKKAIEASNAD
ncbi:hypothetical protein [Pseudoalteromonas peptidolytica]|uniref:Lipoprotein n=1 Tax=Pseudoalteromonas peptidolytica F12-50-A1 TaxID=1315280 RepID=A0A8I0MZI6_9GAMM|nr:hypothetical protein [Pseudoalteromonas peptidolytica]MBE0348800.1 hypothetical protein [Pseudoalteromonas peptidolytica F12-50-A1]NLR16788.1 hypothetical protein [Pseudoalteromonas peptidolytica]GEK09041.1 hypothetical protein PPE03_12900 [Pseudoalteromonas peptidolytica]